MMRFNHTELTLPIGLLTAQVRHEIDDFYGSVFGWSRLDTVVVNQSCHLLRLDEYTNQFILLAEHAEPMSSPSYDHLGLLQDTREEVDALLAKCREYQRRDRRVQINQYQDLVNRIRDDTRGGGQAGPRLHRYRTRCRNASRSFTNGCAISGLLVSQRGRANGLPDSQASSVAGRPGPRAGPACRVAARGRDRGRVS